MDFDALFSDQLDLLKKEGNYRIFAELERQSGAFPKAKSYDKRSPENVTIGVQMIILEWDKARLSKML